MFFSLFHPLLTNRIYAPLSAWVPLSGWDAYDGTDQRWMDREIKNMMSANFDIVFHAVQAEGSDPKFGAQGDNRTINEALRNFFSTYRTLIDQAYVPPRISEWVNHEGFGGGRYTEAYGQKLDLSTPAGQDYYYTMLIAHFWRQYFEIMGPFADQYLAKKHGKVMVSLDALSNEYPDITGLSNAFLEALKAQFRSEFGYEIYLMAHPLFGHPGPDLPAIDETHNAFGPSENFYQGGLERATGKATVELLPGFFIPDQDYRTVLRSGGATYEAAWQRALSVKGNVSDHLGVTAWNYYPEGDQLDETQLTPTPKALAVRPTESWGPSPRHYIDLTARYASQWNDMPAHDAQFLTTNLPPTMTAGQAYQVSIAFRNTGDNKWRGDAGCQLVRTIPEAFGSTPREIPVDDSRDEIPLYGGILRGQPIIFRFAVVAPVTPGSYPLQWRMVQQGVGPFGEPTPATTVSVVRADLENDALFVAQSIPTTMTAGQQYTSSITMKNTGILTWTRSAAYRLGSQNPQDNLTWGIGRVELPPALSQVPPGEQVTFAFSVTAPPTAGTYNFQWRMTREGVEWFGDPTPNLQITVTDVSGAPSLIL